MGTPHGRPTWAYERPERALAPHTNARGSRLGAFLTMMRTSGEKKLRARGEKTEGAKSFSPHALEIHEDTKSFPLLRTDMDKIVNCLSPKVDNAIVDSLDSRQMAIFSKLRNRD